ncbi:LOW QUALITY PROTEIN: protein timeless homolog [Drosophila obscura]|uniref:LOW QUALITY PROTEIN: protein timeless homolog n=1 Tax=Drosophila obscura TaxID=7282 RepID=UPI001BB1E8D9|nr:LOW QUALITY PROTEIN: protein timeless homolog [Drosophila obscura]
MSVLLADIDATCAALGYSDGQRYQAEPDAAEGLKHLIWILRRDLDNHEYRRHLGRAKVLETDLVYMLPDYVQHEELSDLLIRLLVILTNPTLLLYREGPPNDNHGRKVFMELIDILQGYKSAFAKDKIWSALFDKLKQALEIGFAIRSEEQNLLIERILVLVRNVLQVPANPEAECRADNDASLHDQVIWALHQTGMLDLVLFVISSPDEEQFHLHGLEILCLLYREQSAESLADASLQRSLGEKQRDQQELLAARRRERARRQARPPTGRHSRFGGTYVIRNMKSVSDRDVICHQALERVASIDFDREKQQQKRSHRHIKEEAQVTRRSAFTVRLCLREYCIEVLRSAYNTLVRQVRRVLERNAGSSSHDDSYLLWAIRFFMEFNRLSGLQLQLVSESLSVQCFHWVLTRMQHDMDMIVSDKKQARLWAKRLHVALLTFRELLQSLLALQKLKDDNARALFDMLLNNVCYVLEYRETILHLLMNYNEAHSTKVFLRDVVETANVFIKMMERFCQDSVVVQDKRRGAGGRRKKQPKAKSKQTAAHQPTEDELSSKWAEMASEVCTVLFGGLNLPEDELPIPFDAASDKSIDDQREDCMIRINKLLRTGKLEQAIALLRAAREVWPENEVFGAISVEPKDELLLLREIFMHNITTVEPQDEDKDNEDVQNDDEDDDDDVENEEFEEQNKGLTEKTFKFDDFARRLLHPKIVRACTLVLTDWAQIPTRALKAAVTVLHRIAYGCSCPGMLFQAKLFRIFQQVLSVERDAHQEELRRLGIYVVRKFVEVAPTNPKIYAELLFYKGIREANELETGYCDAYEAGTKGAWSEEQESELRFLFEENQRNPETDKDVIDWILDNLADKTRTRRGVLKKMKELGLLFKAPTKRSTKSGQSGKNLWQPEEDEMLRSLYDQYRTEPDCLERLVREFGEQRGKQQIIKRMLQIHLIADKSEILPAKSSKGRGKGKAKSSNSDSDRGSGSEADEYMEEPMFEDARDSRKLKNKSRSRQVVRTPLDVGTVQALIAQVDTAKYQPAIEWLTECLNDASEDTDEQAEDDDGVPLLPLLQAQKDAMEDGDFQKVLVALGMQPPIAGMENYWRVPTYLNAADLKLRAKIVAGEEVEIVQENVRQEEEEDEEEDYLDKRSRQRKQAQAENIAAQQQRRLESLMFSKSDDEDQAEQRAPLKGKASGKKAKRQRKGKAKAVEPKESEDEAEVNAIARKLARKKRQPDVSSEEEEEDNDEPKSEPKPKPEKQKETKQPSRASSDDLFEQLKAKRATKIKLADMVLNESTKAVGEGDDDAFNFNSEDYRARLLELEDEENEEQDKAEEQNKENNTSKLSSLSLQRARRVNVIDSDSDNDDAGGASPADKTNKRPRSDDGQESDEASEASDDDANFLARKKPAKVDSGNGKASKRRRVAIIDDDDDDEF